MPDVLAISQAWLAEQLAAHVATEVTYVRGDDRVVVRATIGRTLLKLSDEYGGVRMEWTDRDFLVRTSELMIAGLRISPQAGDVIEESVDGQTHAYEVLAPGGEPPWRWADPHRQMFRIHAKHIKTT